MWYFLMLGKVCDKISKVLKVDYILLNTARS